MSYVFSEPSQNSTPAASIPLTYHFN